MLPEMYLLTIILTYSMSIPGFKTIHFSLGYMYAITMDDECWYLYCDKSVLIIYLLWATVPSYSVFRLYDMIMFCGNVGA